MQFSKKATSLIEAMIIMTIVSLGLIGLYDFYMSSQKLADTTSDRIKAIQIAREGIEAVTNIRNTNWLLYGADFKNCWNVQNYDIRCIGNNSDTYDITPISYILNQDGDNRWHLDGLTSTDSYFTGTYRTEFGVEIAANGFYNQDISNGVPDAFFTREIIISYPEDTNSDGALDSNDEKMFVRSFVQWGNNTVHKVELNTTLTNWKNKN